MKLISKKRVVLLVIICFFIASCRMENTINDGSKQKSSSSNPKGIPIKITRFQASPLTEDGILKLKFSLVDANERFIAADVQGIMVVKGSDGKILYNGSKSISASEFTDTKSPAMGDKTGHYVWYSWHVPLNEISKVTSEDSGGAQLLISVGNNKLPSAQTIVTNLPQLTNEEMINISEEAYEAKAKTLGKIIENENFKVEFKKFGYYEIPPRFGAANKHGFRVDVTITNKGIKERNFFGNYVIMFNQQRTGYGHLSPGFNTFSSFNPPYLQPGKTIEGWLLFDPPEPNITVTLSADFNDGDRLGNIDIIT